jgi:hypothetical protein
LSIASGSTASASPRTLTTLPTGPSAATAASSAEVARRFTQIRRLNFSASASGSSPSALPSWAATVCGARLLAASATGSTNTLSRSTLTASSAPRRS